MCLIRTYKHELHPEWNTVCDQSLPDKEITFNKKLVTCEKCKQRMGNWMDKVRRGQK